jgi:hypothetical protein
VMPNSMPLTARPLNRTNGTCQSASGMMRLRETAVPTVTRSDRAKTRYGARLPMSRMAKIFKAVGP